MEICDSSGNDGDTTISLHHKWQDLTQGSKYLFSIAYKENPFPKRMRKNKTASKK